MTAVKSALADEGRAFQARAVWSPSVERHVDADRRQRQSSMCFARV